MTKAEKKDKQFKEWVSLSSRDKWEKFKKMKRSNMFNKKCPLTNKEKLHLILQGLQCTQIQRDTKGNYLGLNTRKFEESQPNAPYWYKFPDLCENCSWNGFEGYSGYSGYLSSTPSSPCPMSTTWPINKPNHTKKKWWQFWFKK